MIRQIAVRILAALHATLGRWLALADVPEVKRRRISWFDLPQSTFAPPRSPEDEEAAEWDRKHLRIINGRPINPNTRGRL